MNACRNGQSFLQRGGCYSLHPVPPERYACRALLFKQAGRFARPRLLNITWLQCYTSREVGMRDGEDRSAQAGHAHDEC